MSTEVVKRHARTRRGCLTCRIRKKKCDSLRPSCTKCERLHVQCLGYASDRPDWLKGDNAKGYTQAIKCFLSEYPAAKAYDDPVPYLVLKATADVESSLAREPGRFNPVYFDPATATLKRWLPSAPPPPRESPEITFSNTANSGESSSYPPSYQATTSNLPSPYLPPTPSPRTPYGHPGPQYPVHSYIADVGLDVNWTYTPSDVNLFLDTAPLVATQPNYNHLTHGIPALGYHEQLDGHTVHYVGGPIALPRQDAYTSAACKTGFDETWPPMSWFLH